MRSTLTCLVALLFAGCPTEPDPCGPPCDAVLDRRVAVRA